VQANKSKAVRIASSHLITTCATAAAILLFVALGSQVLPAAMGAVRLPDSDGTLVAAFILNIAIILFGWRRSKDLREALELYEAAERLAEVNANTDPTTGLANRRELIRGLQATKGLPHRGVLLLLDLDHFKRVNDLHGHLAGDRLLKAVGVALQKVSPEDGCCARIGGDEFALLLPTANKAAAEAVAGRILEELALPVSSGAAQILASASIGLAEVRAAHNEEDILHESDIALYAAKRAGRNGFAWFDPELEREITDRVKLEDDIRRGIGNGEFIPFFQPLIDLNTRELVGFETLARWRSPERGLLEAQIFIEAAERTGLVGPLTLSVMRQALEEARNWPDHLKIAVNVSPIQFKSGTLALKIMSALAASGLAAGRLELEITEAVLIRDDEAALAILHQLRTIGVRIALDDFGTGYSSLSYLQRFPFDKIKVDRSFVKDIAEPGGGSSSIVQAVVNIAAARHMTTTAEGVETEQQRQMLRALGCSEMQGYLLSAAKPADQIKALFAAYRESFAVSPVRKRRPKSA
jgi:diguanylate cyclase (GGDEF)-like protein